MYNFIYPIINKCSNNSFKPASVDIDTNYSTHPKQ